MKNAPNFVLDDAEISFANYDEMRAFVEEREKNTEWLEQGVRELVFGALHEEPLCAPVYRDDPADVLCRKPSSSAVRCTRRAGCAVFWGGLPELPEYDVRLIFSTMHRVLARCSARHQRIHHHAALVRRYPKMGKVCKGR